MRMRRNRQTRKLHKSLLSTFFLISAIIFVCWITWNSQSKQIKKVGEAIQTTKNLEMSEKKQETSKREKATSTKLETNTQEETSIPDNNNESTMQENTQAQTTSEFSTQESQQGQEANGDRWVCYIDGQKYFYDEAGNLYLSLNSNEIVGNKQNAIKNSAQQESEISASENESHSVEGNAMGKAGAYGGRGPDWGTEERINNCEHEWHIVPSRDGKKWFACDKCGASKIE